MACRTGVRLALQYSASSSSLRWNPGGKVPLKIDLRMRSYARCFAVATKFSKRSGPAAAFARRVLRDPSAVVAVAGWPADPLHDPLAAFYCAAGAWQHGTKTWLAMSASLKGIVDRQLMSGRHASTWDPVVPDGEPFAGARVLIAMVRPNRSSGKAKSVGSLGALATSSPLTAKT